MTTKKEMQQLLQRLAALEQEVSVLRAQQESTPPRTHDLATAARMIGKSPHWLRRACQTGLIKHFTRVGQTLRFTDDHIRKILADFEGRPYSDARLAVA